MEETMSLSHPLISPAYNLENIAFNSWSQPTNSIQKHVLARIAAVVAPIFYAYQIGLHLVGAMVEFVTCLLGITEGNFCKNALSSTLYSVRCLISSILEIPHKLIQGPYDVPNYCGNADRYVMVTAHHWANRVVWS